MGAPGLALRMARSGLIAAAVGAVLSFPVVAFFTRPGPSGALLLEPKPWNVVGLAVAIGVLSALGTLIREQGSRVTAPIGAAAGPLLKPLAPYLPRAGLAALLLYPPLVVTLVGWAGAIKWVDNFGVQILIYVLLGWGLSFVVGLAGLLDLGFIAFAAVGAYSYTLISAYVLPVYAPALVPFAFWVLLPVAAVLAACWGIVVGAPVLGLRGDYLAVVTLAFGEMVRLVLVNWSGLTHGNAGMKAPHVTFFGLPFTTSGDEPTFASVFGLSGSPTIYRSLFLYYVILALALLAAAVSIRLRRLPIGRAWEALREDEIASRALGINSVTTKLSAFAMGAAFGGIAGEFFAARQGFINPKSFEFMQSATVLAIVVLGGMSSLSGIALAAIAMIGGTELLRELGWLKSIFGPAFDPTQYRMLLFGIAMVTLMVWKPRGLAGPREPTITLKERG